MKEIKTIEDIYPLTIIRLYESPFSDKNVDKFLITNAEVNSIDQHYIDNRWFYLLDYKYSKGETIDVAFQAYKDYYSPKNILTRKGFDETHPNIMNKSKYIYNLDTNTCTYLGDVSIERVCESEEDLDKFMNILNFYLDDFI